MATPAIVNSTAVSSASTQTVKQADSSSNGAFSQMLSQEVANRDNANNNHSNDSTKDTSSASSNAPPSASSGVSSKVPAKTADKDKAKGDEDDSQQSDATDAATTTTPADMLALVANANQITAKTDKPAAADTAAELAADDKLSSSIKLDLAGRVDAKQISANAAKTITAADKDVAAKTSKDFNAVMQKADESKQPADSSTAAIDKDKLETKAADLDTKIAALTESVSKNKQESVPATAMPTVAQANAINNQPVNGQVMEKLAPSVGTPAWDQALGQKVVWMVAGGEQSASLTLNPPDLGPLHVVLNISNSQASASFTAAQPEVRQALESAMPKLREMLGDAGIQLGQATVSAGTQNHSNQSFSDQQQSSRSSRSFSSSSDTSDTSIRVSRGPAISSGQGLVDTFA